MFEEGELTLGKSKAEKVKGVQFFEKDDNTDCPYVEWTFNVEETGLYEMYMNYKAPRRLSTANHPVYFHSEKEINYDYVHI